MKIILNAILAGAVLLTGCATQMKAYYERPVAENSVSGAVASISLSADRRTVIVVLEGDNRGKFCAEPPPDVGQNIKSSLEAAIKAKATAVELANGAESPSAEGEATIKDSYESEIVILAQRTALLDIYRTGTYALCQYHLNGAFSDSELTDGYMELTKMVIESMGPTSH